MIEDIGHYEDDLSGWSAPAPPGGRTARRGPIRLDPDIAEIIDDVSHLTRMPKKVIVEKAVHAWVRAHRQQLESAIGEAHDRLRTYRSTLSTKAFGIPVDRLADLDHDDDGYCDPSPLELLGLPGTPEEVRRVRMTLPLDDADDDPRA